MRIIILGGFLGAGKTTAMIDYARFLNGTVKRPSSAPPIVILENEISDVGIDSRRLEQEKLTVRNITGGCVCCTSTLQLSQSLHEVEMSYHPEYVMIEATGMAYPDTISQNLKSETDHEIRVLALVDAARWTKTRIAMPDFVTSQLREASVILINKTDRVEKETLQTVREEVKRCQPDAAVHAVSLLDAQPDAFWADIQGELGWNTQI